MSTITIDSVFPKYVGQSPTARVSISKATNFMDHATFYDLFDEVAINPNKFNRDLQKVFKMLWEGLIEARSVDKIPLNKIVKAHNDIERGGMNGAIVCLPFGFSDTPSSVTSSEDSLNSIECTSSSMKDSFSSYGLKYSEIF